MGGRLAVKKKQLTGGSDMPALPVSLAGREEKMEGFTVGAAAEAVHGIYTGPEEGKGITFSSVAIDSRKVVQDSLFVAIKGQRVDGNRFVPGAYEDGAACCMSTLPAQDLAVPYIQVQSCEQALKDMAQYYRGIRDVTVVGITGSVGKTTTKEMIATVLSQKYDTLKTQGNLNNEIGLPLTVFAIRPHHQVAVLEMGISDFGEMHRLAKVARPDACVITNIGQCHLENLGSRDGVLKAKTEVFDFLKEGGTAYLNGDDDKLVTLVDDTRIKNPFYFSIRGEERPGGAVSKVTARNIHSLGLAGSSMELVAPEGSIQVDVPSPGRHMVSNALAAASVGIGLGLSLEQIKAGIEAYKPVDGHGHVLRTASLTIMDDCYNANPVSMKAGIDVLAEVEGRRVAILGDMFELGDGQMQMHYEVGRHAAARGIDVLVAVGTLGRGYAQGAGDYVQQDTGKAKDSKTDIFYLETLEDVLEKLPELVQEQDAVLVKASHGMHFEKIVKKLQELE